MTIREAAAALEAGVLHEEFEDLALKGAYTSDLLSDVIAHAEEGGILVTIQAHVNTVAVAELKKIRAIVICNSRPVPAGMLRAAKAGGIALLRSVENQFTVSGKLYRLLKGASENC